jgi:hypothetical protein
VQLASRADVVRQNFFPRRRPLQGVVLVRPLEVGLGVGLQDVPVAEGRAPLVRNTAGHLGIDLKGVP